MSIDDWGYPAPSHDSPGDFRAAAIIEGQPRMGGGVAKGMRNGVRARDGVRGSRLMAPTNRPGATGRSSGPRPASDGPEDARQFPRHEQPLCPLSLSGA